jgi:hypothetical protein
MSEFDKIYNPPVDLNVAGLNRNTLPYPTEVGSVYFPPVNIEDVKSYNLSLSVNRYNEKVEYLQKQADILLKEYEKVREAVELAYLIDQSKYAFKPVAGNVYHLQKHHAGQLVLNHSNITYLELICKVIYKADGEWEKFNG